MTKKNAEKALDKRIEAEYYKQGNGVQINVMDIGKLFNDCKTALASGVALEVAITSAIAKYRQN